MTAKVKADVATALSVIFILMSAALAFFSNHLSGLTLIFGLLCGSRAAMWKKEISLEKEPEKSPIKVPTCEAKKRVFICFSIALPASQLTLAWYLGRVRPFDMPLYIAFILVDAFLIFWLWSKLFPSSK